MNVIKIDLRMTHGKVHIRKRQYSGLTVILAGELSFGAKI